MLLAQIANKVWELMKKGTDGGKNTNMYVESKTNNCNKK